MTLLNSFWHRRLAACIHHQVVRAVAYGIVILTILAPSHEIFYCYDIPRWYRHVGIDDTYDWYQR